MNAGKNTEMRDYMEQRKEEGGRGGETAVPHLSKYGVLTLKGPKSGFRFIEKLQIHNVLWWIRTTLQLGVSKRVLETCA